MARRFRRFRRRAARAFSGRSFRRSRSRSSGSTNFTDWLIAGAAYEGIIRPAAKNILPAFFSFGPVESDDVILAAGGYYISKKGGIVGALGKYAMAREAGAVAAKMLGGSSGSGGNLMNAY